MVFYVIMIKPDLTYSYHCEGALVDKPIEHSILIGAEYGRV
jgi:hypothetical protein